MQQDRWWDKLLALAGTGGSTPAARKRAVPGLEALEQREMPSVAPTFVALSPPAPGELSFAHGGGANPAQFRLPGDFQVRTISAQQGTSAGQGQLPGQSQLPAPWMGQLPAPGQGQLPTTGQGQQPVTGQGQLPAPGTDQLPASGQGEDRLPALLPPIGIGQLPGQGKFHLPAPGRGAAKGHSSLSHGETATHSGDSSSSESQPTG